jgi:Flp pilus assembly protein CpaB
MILYGIIIVLAIVFGAILLVQSKNKKRAAQWPGTRGRVIQSELYWGTDADGKPAQEVAVTYEYVVAGQTLRSTRVKFGFAPKPLPTVRKYPLGTDVQVFYNPAKPAEAVLER